MLAVIKFVIIPCESELVCVSSQAQLSWIKIPCNLIKKQ